MFAAGKMDREELEVCVLKLNSRNAYLQFDFGFIYLVCDAEHDLANLKMLHLSPGSE
jgi:hypothetical protein